MILAARRRSRSHSRRLPPVAPPPVAPPGRQRHDVLACLGASAAASAGITLLLAWLTASDLAGGAALLGP